MKESAATALLAAVESSRCVELLHQATKLLDPVLARRVFEIGRDLLKVHGEIVTKHCAPTPREEIAS